MARAYVHSRLRTWGGRRRAAKCVLASGSNAICAKPLATLAVMNPLWPVVRSWTMVSRPSSVSRTVTINNQLPTQGPALVLYRGCPELDRHEFVTGVCSNRFYAVGHERRNGARAAHASNSP